MAGQLRFGETLALCISLSSVISSGLYTYVYIASTQTEFFNGIHTEYASTEMKEALDVLEVFRDATAEDYSKEYLRLKQLARMSYLNAKAGEAMLQCAKATDGEKHCKASGPDSDNVGATGPKDFKTVFDFVNADPHRKSEGSDASGFSSDIALGRLLDGSRRRVLHFYGKICMLHKLGYLRNDHLEVFPGKARAEHALSLVEPLTLGTQKVYGGSTTHEHVKTFDSVRTIFGISHSVQ